MNQNTRRRSTSADKMVNVVIVLVIAAFIVLGVFAVKDKLNLKPQSQDAATDADTSTSTAQTVEQLADAADMSVDEYLAQYGLAVGDTLTADSTESDMINEMTIENYAAYEGTTADDLLSGLSDQVTKDTLFKDLKDMPAKTVVGEETFNQAKETYGLSDDAVNDETTFATFESILYYAQQAAQQDTSSADATTDADTTDTAAADTASTDAAAQPAE